MSEPVLRVQDLCVHFNIRKGGWFRQSNQVLKAVDGVSFSIEAGKTLDIIDMDHLQV